jgi:hypothetical protein
MDSTFIPIGPEPAISILKTMLDIEILGRNFESKLSS